jgi:hypothetical protein
MDTRRLRMVLSLVVAAFAPSTFAIDLGNSGMNGFGASEPPSRFFPGKYFQQKAQFYLKKKDYSFALQMFELSGFWADKISQYNAGLMHFNGIGVPADKARGVAWLRIAAEAHDDLAERALQLAQADLNDAERARAEAIWNELDHKYGDRVSLPRALAQYEQDMAMLTGSHLGHPIGPLTVQVGNDVPEIGSEYINRIGKERDELIGKIRGHVRVGSVQALNVPRDAKANASHMPIDVPQAPPAKPRG